MANPDSIVTLNDEYGYVVGYVLSPGLMDKIKAIPGVEVGPPQKIESPK